MSGGWIPNQRCICGKRGYLTRAAAKNARKQLHGGGHLNAYQCIHTPDHLQPLWHLRHLPTPIVKGLEPRDRATQQIRTESA